MERTLFVSYTTRAGQHSYLYVEAKNLVAFLKHLVDRGDTINAVEQV